MLGRSIANQKSPMELPKKSQILKNFGPGGFGDFRLENRTFGPKSNVLAIFWGPPDQSQLWRKFYPCENYHMRQKKSDFFFFF